MELRLTATPVIWPACYYGNFLLVGTKAQSIFFFSFKELGRVVRKAVNANPGLKVNRSNNFSCIKVLSIAYVLCSLRLFMLKTEGQNI